MDESGNSRKPPFSQDAEEALLGAILLDSTIINDVVNIIDADDFYRPQNRTIYEHLTTMWEKGDPIDVLTLQDSLKNQKVLDKVGGAVYIDQLFDSVPSSRNAPYYAKIVHNFSLRRQISELGSDLINLANNSPDTSEKIMDEVGQKFIDLAQQKSIMDVFPMKSLVEELSKDLGNRQIEKGMSGLEIGFSDIDKKLGGFQKSDFIILAARPSVGKTALALNIAENVARQGKRVLIFSLEMSASQLALRLLSSISGVNSQKLRQGEISKSDMKSIQEALAEMDEMNIFINENSTISPLGIRAEARRLAFDPTKGVDLIIIDYLQLISSPSIRRNDNRVQEVSDISRAMKTLGRELKVPVLALSQLSRDSEKQTRIPRLSDLRESGALEQDADVVMFLHRDEKKEKLNLDQRTFDMKLIIAKHRNGPTGIIPMKFEKARTRFYVEVREQEVSFDDQTYQEDDYEDEGSPFEDDL